MFKVYMGRKVIAKGDDKLEVVRNAVEILKVTPTKNGYLPMLSVYDTARLMHILFITDDADGITIHHRSSK